MPIVSRELVKLANRDDIAPGVKRYRVDGIDGRGDRWVHGPFFATEPGAEMVVGIPFAEDVRDAAWTTEQLEDQDERKGVEFILAGGAVESFAREDLTLQEWRRRVARRWWNTRIGDEESRKFLCLVADYITGFTAVQIAAALGISEAMATKGLLRAIDLRDNVCPAMNASDAEQEEV